MEERGLYLARKDHFNQRLGEAKAIFRIRGKAGSLVWLLRFGGKTGLREPLSLHFAETPVSSMMTIKAGFGGCDSCYILCSRHIKKSHDLIFIYSVGTDASFYSVIFNCLGIG